MTVKNLKVISHDNRGDEKVPFGFVYFNDESRVVYSKHEVRPTVGPYWNLPGPEHVNLAIEYLTNLGLFSPEQKEVAVNG